MPKRNSSKKLNTVYSFPHKFPGLSYPLVNSEKRVYWIVPTECKIVKKIDYPETLNLKLKEANLEKILFWRLLETQNGTGPHVQKKSSPSSNNTTPNIITTLQCMRIACGWTPVWPYRRIYPNQYWTDYTTITTVGTNCSRRRRTSGSRSCIGISRGDSKKLQKFLKSRWKP